MLAGVSTEEEMNQEELIIDAERRETEETCSRFYSLFHRTPFIKLQVYNTACRLLNVTNLVKQTENRNGN